MGLRNVTYLAMITPKLTRKPKKPWKLILDTFKGVATLLDDVILGKKFAKEAVNLYQVQDGRWRRRWGTRKYGIEIEGETEIVGAGIYTASDGSQKIVAVGGTGTAYVSANGGGSWSELTGITFDTDAERYWFEQAGGYLLICNGKDYLTRFDGSTLTRYTAIDTPTGLAGVRNVLTSGSYHNYYKVTALNTVGETPASTEIDVTTNKERDTWDADSDERVDLSWTAVPGAAKYQVYYSTQSGEQVLLAETDTNSYEDDASAVPNPFIVAPDFDTTGAPKFSMVRKSSTRLVGIDPENHPNTVFFSGTGQYLGYFADAYGGGWVKLDEGSGETVQFVGHFRSGKGDPAATILTKTQEGTGSIWQLQFIAQELYGITFIIPVPSQIVGSVGTNAPGAVIEARDSLFFPNKRGVFGLNNKENVTNILSTTEFSGNIRPSVRDLLDMDKMAGYWYDSKLIFSASEGGGENDIIFGFDTERNQWFWKWTIGFRQFFEYTDSDGTTRLIGVPTTGAHLTEIGDYIQGDDGEAFQTSYISGLIPIDKDETLFAKVIEAMLVLGRPKGSITFEIFGIGKKGDFGLIASKQVSGGLTANEFWTGLLGEITLKDEEDAPVTYTQASVKTVKRIRKTMNAIQFRVSSNSAEAEYTILKIQADGFYKPTRTPSSWRN